MQDASPQPNAPVPVGNSINAIIWGALTFAPVVYCVVAFLQRPGGPSFSLPDFSNPLELGLTAGAVASLIAAFVVPPLIAARLRSELEKSIPPDPAQRAFAEQRVMIVRGALFEAVVIYGFVMVCAGGPASRVVPFAAVSLAMLLLHFPTRERLAEPFER